MQIIIKNKNKFTSFIKKNDKQKYNKDVKKYYYLMLEDDTANKLDGLTSFEISSQNTKSHNPESIYYTLKHFYNKDDELVKVIIEF